MRRVARNSFLVVLAVILAVLAVAIVRKWNAPEVAEAVGQRVAPLVEVSTVTTGSIQDIRRLTGTLRPRTEVTLAPKISGRLESLQVDIGDRVTRGQVIALLDDDEQREEVARVTSDVDVAQAQLERARAEEEQSRRELDRMRALSDRQVVSAADLDAAEVALRVRQAATRVAQSELAQREAALRTAEIRLAYTRITAEWDGDNSERVVGERFVEEGDVLQSNQPILSLLDLNELTAVVYVTERDYARLRVGQEVRVAGESNPGRAVTGRISRMAPQFRESSRQARVEVTVPNPNHQLLPGMFVRTEVLIETRDEATLVPIRALVERNRVRGVFTVNTETNTAHYVPVQVGITEGGLAEIISPAVSGRVVTLGHNLVTDGGPVRIVPAGGQTTPNDDLLPEQPAIVIGGTDS